MPFKVKIFEISLIKITIGEEEESVVKICYQYGTDFSRCFLVREEDYSPDTIKELIKKDFEAQLLKPKPVIEID